MHHPHSPLTLALCYLLPSLSPSATCCLLQVMYAGDLAYAGLSTSLPRLNISKEDEFERIYGIQTQPVAATRPFMVGTPSTSLSPPSLVPQAAAWHGH